MTPADIKAFRKGAGLSQAALAELLGRHRNSVQEWESGRHAPPPELSLALAAIYHKIRPWPECATTD